MNIISLYLAGQICPRLPWGLRHRCNVTLTGALDEQLLPVAAQQGPRQEGSKVDEDLPQKRSRLLQSMFQTLRDAEIATR